MARIDPVKVEVITYSEVAKALVKPGVRNPAITACLASIRLGKSIKDALCECIKVLAEANDELIVEVVKKTVPQPAADVAWVDGMVKPMDGLRSPVVRRPNRSRPLPSDYADVPHGDISELGVYDRSRDEGVEIKLPDAVMDYVAAKTPPSVAALKMEGVKTEWPDMPIEHGMITSLPPTVPDDDRVAILWVNELQLLALATGHIRVTNLPMDARAIAGFHSPERRAFGLRMQSQEFRLICPGGEVPSFIAMFEDVAKVDEQSPQTFTFTGETKKINLSDLDWTTLEQCRDAQQGKSWQEIVAAHQKRRRETEDAVMRLAAVAGVEPDVARNICADSINAFVESAGKSSDVVTCACGAPIGSPGNRHQYPCPKWEAE